jgi:outer membrane protein assembly factor BamA
VGLPLGGDFIGTILLAATAPVPLASVAGWIRTLAFVNAGTISGKLMTVTPMDVVRSTRVSAGVGLLLNMSPIRVSLSYSVPVVKAPHDVLSPWQLGLALEIA